MVWVVSSSYGWQHNTYTVSASVTLYVRSSTDIADFTLCSLHWNQPNAKEARLSKKENILLLKNLVSLFVTEKM